MDLRLCELSRLVISDSRDVQMVVLREKDGERLLPMEIGRSEALAINREIHGNAAPRPLSHDLMLAIITALGAQLHQVIIHDLVMIKENSATFMAVLRIFNTEKDYLAIDCRPSDALALAVRANCQIMVSEKVLVMAGFNANEPFNANE